MVLGHGETYFVKEHSDSKNKYNVLEFPVDNIFVVFAVKVFDQAGGIPMGTNCSPILADIFLYSYEAKSIVFALNGKETVSILGSISLTDTLMMFIP